MEMKSSMPSMLEERVAAIEADMKHVATKADIESVKTLIADREATMLKWLVGVVSGTGLAIFIALLRFLL